MARTILTNANLLDGELPAAAGSRVVIEGERISEVHRGGDRVTGGPDDEVVDLAGRTVMPGMVIGHYHPSYVDVGSSIGPFGLENPVGFTAMVAARNAEIALACGFTGAVGAGSPYDIDPSLARAVEEGVVNGPRIVPCSRELSTTGHSNDWAPWWWEVGAVGVARLCDGAEAFRYAVREEIKHGSRMIKLYVTGGHGVMAPKEQVEMTRDELKAAIDTAHSRGARIRGHIANKDAILTALELGMDVIDHADGMDDECISALLEADACVVPGLYFPECVLRSLEQSGTDDPAMRADLEASYEAIAKAAAAGVKICLGDDYGAIGLNHGTYHQEMIAYVKNLGVSPLEVIKWATVNGAHVLGMGDELGRVEAGRLADLVVVDGDPSQDISILSQQGRIEAVMRSGQVKVGRLPV